MNGLFYTDDNLLDLCCEYKVRNLDEEYIIQLLFGSIKLCSEENIHNSHTYELATLIYNQEYDKITSIVNYNNAPYYYKNFREKIKLKMTHDKLYM